MMCAMSASHISTPPTGHIHPASVQNLLAHERASYIARHPRSQAQAARTAQHLMFGVPLHWMNDWATPFALHMAHAQGAHLTDL